MQLLPKLFKKLNDQLNAEIQSAYLYLAMGAWLEGTMFKGFAHWMKKQAKEELEHAMRFYEYINDRGNLVTLQTIPEPQKDFKDIQEVFSLTLKHEQLVTQLVHEAYQTAQELKDFATMEFLNWFLKEQIEEEKTASDILGVLTLAKDQLSAIIAEDQKAAQR